jgi:hypothetical protein
MNFGLALTSPNIVMFFMTGTEAFGFEVEFIGETVGVRGNVGVVLMGNEEFTVVVELEETLFVEVLLLVVVVLVVFVETAANGEAEVKAEEELVVVAGWAIDRLLGEVTTDKVGVVVFPNS